MPAGNGFLIRVSGLQYIRVRHSHLQYIQVRQGSGGLFCGAPVLYVAAFSTALSKKADLPYLHGLINRLAHIIYGKKSHAYACERLHLHACLPGHLYRAVAVYRTFLRIHLEL